MSGQNKQKCKFCLNQFSRFHHKVHTNLWTDLIFGNHMTWDLFQSITKSFRESTTNLTLYSPAKLHLQSNPNWITPLIRYKPKEISCRCDHTLTQHQDTRRGMLTSSRQPERLRSSRLQSRAAATLPCRLHCLIAIGLFVLRHFAGYSTFWCFQGHSRPASGRPSVCRRPGRRAVTAAPRPCPLLSRLPLAGEKPGHTPEPLPGPTGSSTLFSHLFPFCLPDKTLKQRAKLPPGVCVCYATPLLCHRLANHSISPKFIYHSRVLRISAAYDTNHI